MNNSTRRLLETVIVSTAELSALTGVPMITLQKWAERGQVDFVKKGRTYLFDRRDFTGPTVGPSGRVQGKIPTPKGKKAAPAEIHGGTAGRDAA